MRSFFIVFLLVHCICLLNVKSAQSQCLNGCSHDSVWTVCLSEIKITPVSGEGDPVYNFYRPIKSFTTEEILSRLPALSMTRRSNFGMEPGIRGLSGSRMNVTLDGMKIFGACTDKMDPVTIYVEPQNLESFELGTGACGAEHGSTVGGSLDMKLKNPDFSSERSVNALAGTTYHSVSNSFFGFAGVDISNDRWAAKVNAVYRQSDNYKAGGAEVVPFSSYKKNNLSASLKYRLSISQSLKLDYITDNGLDIGFSALSMDVRYAYARIGSLSWKYHSAKSTLQEAEVKVYGNSIRHMMDDRDRSGLSMHMDMPGISKTTGSSAKFKFNLSKSLSLKSTFDYYSNTLFAEMFMYPEGGSTMYMLTLPETQRQVGGIYLSPVWKPDSLNAITLGGRWDFGYTEMKDPLGLAQLEIFYPAADSTYQKNLRSVYLEYERKISRKIVAGLQSGWGERLPSSQEMLGYYLYNRLDGYDYIGKPDLKNESSAQISFLLRFESKRWSVSLSPFVNKIRNYIEGERDAGISPMTEGAHGVKIYTNNGSALMQGAELALKYLSSGPWSMISTGKYIQGQKSDGKAMWQIPPFKSLTSVKYRKGLYSVQAETEWSAAQNRIDEESGETKTPAYIIFHLRFSANWMIATHSVEINGGVENIGDNFYHEHLDWGGVPRPGRNFYATVAYRF